MAVRDIYLKIETLPDYSPVFPEDHAAAPKQYGRDCMRTPGHEDGTIPQAEINARALTALVYREYLDPGYVFPKPDKLISSDVNEPVYNRRVPGTVIYCHPGDRLLIHVLNWDTMPHTFHIHGLRFGIDSDGSWPFGTQATDGRRSDEICPGERWTYIYDVTDEMIGAWPFHDHYRHINESVNRGLFGGLVVLPKPRRFPPVIELPRDLHHLLDDLRRNPLPLRGPGPHVLPGAHLHMETHRASAVGLRGPGFTVASRVPVHGAAHAEHTETGPAADWREARVLDLQEWAQLQYIHPLIPRERTLHIPIFLHNMVGTGGTPAFDSPELSPGAIFDVTFGAAGTFHYKCRLHPVMMGTVNVAAGAPSLAAVTIRDNPTMMFDPSSVTIAPGGSVHWTHGGTMNHTVTDEAGGMSTPCINGRAFVGNTPTVVAHAGQRIRWYVFNLDLGMMWHNFHTHGQRWNFAGEPVDIRSIGPAESFMVETVAPRVLTLPPDVEAKQAPGKRPKGAHAYDIRGDFLFHCHVEMHMMMGLVGLLRSRERIWLTAGQATALAADRGLPIDTGSNACPAVDFDHCENVSCGRWEEVPGNPAVVMMHAALLPKTDKVLYWGYDRADQSRIWDAATGTYAPPANQPADVASTPGSIPLGNLWSAEHAFLNDANGTLVAHGGFTPNQAYRFDPVTLAWSRTGPTAHQRFYSTSLTLSDGRVLTILGGSPSAVVSRSIEVYDPGPGSWAAPIALPPSFAYLFYPWTYLLPDGDLFIAGPTGVTRKFNWSAPVDDPARTWNTIAGNRSTGGEKGTSVLLPLRPPGYGVRVLIAGGNTPAAQSTSEIIDLTAATPAWSSAGNLNHARPYQFTSVLLPDSQILIAGGVLDTADGGPAEILDTRDIAGGWKLCSSMNYKREYHSSNILLADGSVLMGGDPRAGDGNPTPHERYYPWYFTRPRPTITSAPATVTFGSTFTINTPDAASIGEVILIRPGAVTHGFNQSQRLIECVLTATHAASVEAQAPPDGFVAPPGYYLLFIVDGSRVPSVGRWIRLTP